MADDIDQLVRAAIQAKVLEAFKSKPEYIDEMVKAAISGMVNEGSGRPNDRGSWSGSKEVPYLTYAVGLAIRGVVDEVVKAHIESRREFIADAVAEAFQDKAMIAGFADAVLRTIKDGWRVSVSVDHEKKSDY